MLKLKTGKKVTEPGHLIHGTVLFNLGLYVIAQITGINSKGSNTCTESKPRQRI